MWELKLVNDVPLYYNFLYKDDDETLAEDLIQWDIKDFKKWKSRGYHVSTDVYNASKTVSSTNVTLNITPAAATAKQKEQEDSFLN